LDVEIVDATDVPPPPKRRGRTAYGADKPKK
jgi:hypothetical protein